MLFVESGTVITETPGKRGSLTPAFIPDVNSSVLEGAPGVQGGRAGRCGRCTVWTVVTASLTGMSTGSGLRKRLE